MKKYVIGIDVGGTNVKLGLVDHLGFIRARSHFPTKAFLRNKNKLISAVLQNIQNFLTSYRLREKDVAGIGIGLPGLVDPVNGVVKFLPNIPGWKDVPLQKLLQKRLRIPVLLENDVNMITLGEWKYGAGVGVRNLICMTLGTGVGGGLILNNALYRGEGFAAGEIGHIPINANGLSCNCGGLGCLERYVGNHYLYQRIKEIFPGQSLGLEEMSRLAKAGDRKALRFWEETARHLGCALTGVVNLLNPTRLIIGGGVAENYQLIVKTLGPLIKKRAMKVQARMVKIVKAKLGNDASILGAKVLVTQRGNSSYAM